MKWQGEFLTREGKIVRMRFPERSDLEKLVRMYTTLSQESMRFLRPYKFSKNEVRDMLERVDFKNVYSIVAEWEGEIVAEARLIRHSDKTAEIGIIVHDRFKNQGIGQRLLKEMIEMARKESIEKLIAFVNEKNSAAIHVFKKHGFEVEKRFSAERYIMGRDENALKLSLTLKEEK